MTPADLASALEARASELLANIILSDADPEEAEADAALLRQAAAEIERLRATARLPGAAVDAAIDDLRARLARIREAAKPFVTITRAMEDYWSDDDTYLWGVEDLIVKVRDLRALARELEGA